MDKSIAHDGTEAEVDEELGDHARRGAGESEVFEIRFKRFSIGEDCRLPLSVEMPAPFIDRDEIGGGAIVWA